MKLPVYVSVLWGQIKYHFRMLLRMPRGIFSAFLVPILLLFALHFLFSGNSKLSPENIYLVLGPIVMGIVMTAYDSHALGLLSARTNGVLKRLHGTPLPSWCYFVGRFTATILLSVASSTVVLILAKFLYNFELSPAAIVLAALTVALGALAWASIGTAITRIIKDAHSGQTILTAIYLPLLFISGTFSSFGSEPRWLQSFAKFFPAHPIAQGIQHILSGASLLSMSSIYLYGILLAWAIFGILISTMTFRWE